MARQSIRKARAARSVRARSPAEASAREAAAAAWRRDQTRRASISFLISPIACAGFKPFGQVRAQFMMVWQR